MCQGRRAGKAGASCRTQNKPRSQASTRSKSKRAETWHFPDGMGMQVGGTGRGFQSYTRVPKRES